MFKKRFRLNTSQFKEVFNFGRVIRTDYALVKKKENSLAFPRFSVVVSKKIAKKAFERNHLKRRFYHALAQKSTPFEAADYVFVLNPQVKGVQYKELLAHINSLSL